MIGWMQQNNKYLVWTIWIATIAFIGAGFVGWGSYSFGSNRSTIAKVGNIEIDKSKFDMTYGQMYTYYNSLLQGELDDEKAKEMGLLNQAFKIIKTQAQLLNLADEFGIIVSDSELANQLQQLEIFSKNGQFSREIYDDYLKANRITSKNFEAMLRDEMRANKLTSLFRFEPSPFEINIIKTALGISNNVAFEVITAEQINNTIDEDELKKYWEETKTQYLTKPLYTLEILWTDTKGYTPTQEEIEAYYRENNHNYIDINNTPLSLDEVKHIVVKDIQIQKSKRDAQINYVKWKNEEINGTKQITIEENNELLTPEIWEDIASIQTNEITKPKIVNNKYVSVKLINKKDIRVMTYKEAKPLVVKDYEKIALEQKLDALAQEILKDTNRLQKPYQKPLTIQSVDTLSPLNHQESFQFVQKLFTNNQEQGIISLPDKRVAYRILSQQLTQIEDDESIAQETTQLKQAVFEDKLIKMLDKRYPTKIYVKGLGSE